MQRTKRTLKRFWLAGAMLAVGALVTVGSAGTAEARGCGPYGGWGYGGGGFYGPRVAPVVVQRPVVVGHRGLYGPRYGGFYGTGYRGFYGGRGVSIGFGW